MLIPMQTCKRNLAAIVVAVSGLAPMLMTAQQSDGCRDKRGQAAWVNSPVYNDANELAQQLTESGFRVECIRRSKQEHFFPAQKGAAWFSTNRGTFEVWFLQEDGTFASLEVIEQSQRNGRYTYTFRGTPQVSSVIDSAVRLYFIKGERIVIEVSGDRQLARSLEAALHSP
jgi:hypothetical protein